MRERGWIARWFEERAFGFVRRPVGGNDVFVHLTDVVDRPRLAVGDEVEYEIVQQHKGQRAIHVVLVPE
jgi:cold shock CspA family protein